MDGCVLVLNVHVAQWCIHLQLNITVLILDGDISRDTSERDVLVAGIDLQSAGDVAAAQVAFIHLDMTVELAQLQVGSRGGRLDALAYARETHVAEALAGDDEVAGDTGDGEIARAALDMDIAGHVVDGSVGVVAADLRVALDVAQ